MTRMDPRILFGLGSPSPLARIVSETARARAQTRATLTDLGIEGAAFDRLLLGREHGLVPWVSTDDEAATLDHLFAAMGRVEAPEYGGFSLLDTGRAVANERAIVGRLRNALGGAVAVEARAAFKANHSPVLQYARLLANPEAGLEVASMAETVSARALGFDPDKLVFANPGAGERDLVISAKLGVTAFCVDHPARLARLLAACERHDIDARRLRILLRVASPYTAASVPMRRFGLDLDANPDGLDAILSQLDRAQTRLAGVAFHVGLGARSRHGYEAVWAHVARVFEACRGRGLPSPRILDVGGGLPFSDAGTRLLGQLPAHEQLDALALGLRGLADREGLEAWVESGQGYVGDAGSTYVRVEFAERRQHPARYLPLSPTRPGEFVWAHPARSARAPEEQWLTSYAGLWSFGVCRYVTIHPELWILDDEGRARALDASAWPQLPTLLFGKSCDPLDALNPRVDGAEGPELIRLQMPDLTEVERALGHRRFVLRLPSAAYLDNGGDFNGQSASVNLPARYLGGPGRARNGYLARVLTPCGAPSPASTGEPEYRDRLLSRTTLSPAQIEQAKTLLAEAFVEREFMSVWLRDQGQLDAETEAWLGQLFRAQAEACIESGLSMVRLRAPQGAPEREAEVVAAIAVKRLGPTPPETPAWLARVPAMHAARLMFEIEARVLRWLQRLDGGLKAKLLPMAYLAMSAKTPKTGPRIASLRARVVELARGSADIHSLASMTTGGRSSRVAASIPGAALLARIPYDEVEFRGQRPFAGARFFDGQAGELRVWIHDFSGPARALEPLPRAAHLSLDIGDERFIA